MNDSRTPNDILNDFDTASREPVPPAGADILLDEEKYLPELEDIDLTEEQKVEFLQALWSIMVAFVDLGFGVDSIHHIFPEIAAEISECESGQIESQGKLNGKDEEDVTGS